MAYRKIYFRIHTECYSSGWSSDTDRAAFKEESRRLFQELGWTVKLGCNGGCDTVSKDRQDLYLHPSSFSGVMDEANTYVTDCISKKVVKNNGNLPMYYIENHHEGIITRELFQRVQEEMARRTSKRKVMQKTGKTEQGKYSAKYALSELLVCGECGTPYKRCTWSRNGKKRIVWRCVSRLEFGTKYCHKSPTLDEDKIHNAIVTALNQYGASRANVIADALEIAEIVQSHCGEDGVSMLALQNRLKELSAEQDILVDKVLEDMGNLELNAQLKALAEEKQSILDQMATHQQAEEKQALQAARQRERDEWLEQRALKFTQYEDIIIRSFVEKITVVDAETVLIKIRDDDVEIEQSLC